MMERGSILWLVLAGVVVISAPSIAEISFQGLGLPPAGRFNTLVRGVSSDGSTVVGFSDGTSGSDLVLEAFRWEDGDITGLGDLPGGDFWSVAEGVSGDGSIVAGYGKSHLGEWQEEAFRWTATGGMQGIGYLPGGSYSFGEDISADGSVIVGWGENTNGLQKAFRWTESGGMQDIGPSGLNSYAYGVSSDGSVVVGERNGEAFRWENSVMTGLGDLPGGGFYSEAYDVSADGSVVVGAGDSVLGFEAFRWEDGVMTGLGDLQGGSFRSSANAVSADGSVVVGGSDTGLGGSMQEAFIWDSDHGMRNLQDVLENIFKLDLTGWTLYSATGISADGLTIVGDGWSPGIGYESWIATIPEPTTLILFALGGLMLRRRK